MSTLSTALCLKCERVFDNERRKMCMGTCNHSMCELCFDNQCSGICPVCKKEKSFVMKHINYQAMEMLDQFKEKVNGSEIFSQLLNVRMNKTPYSGACSICNRYRETLRICVGCSQEAGFLIQSENGEFEIPKVVASGELLETRILRVKNSAMCADCMLDNSLHEGHKTIYVEKIKNLSSALGTANILAVIALSLQKIKSRNADLKHNRPYFSMAEVMNQTNELLEVMGSKIDKNLPLAEAFELFFKIFTKANNSNNTFLMDNLLEEGVAGLKLTEDPEERRELEKAMKRAEEIRNVNSSSMLELNDITDVIYLLKSGIFQEWYKKCKSDGDIKELAQGVLSISNDVRRTIPFKVPQEAEKYVKLAEDVLGFFF